MFRTYEMGKLQLFLSLMFDSVSQTLEIGEEMKIKTKKYFFLM